MGNGVNGRKLGYWFGGSVLPHGDGRRVRVGATLKVKPPIALCNRGLHYSRHVLDALRYAKSSTLWLVEDVGVTLAGDDKCCTTARKHLAKIDAGPILQEFARWCALDVIDKWDAPEIVVRYLETGDETIRDAACAAASDADWAAAEDAAWDAARDAAWAAAWYGAGAADTACAAVSAARAVTWDAFWTAAWAAARDAAATVAIKRYRAKLARMVNNEFKRVGVKL